MEANALPKQTMTTHKTKRAEKTENKQNSPQPTDCP